MLLIRKNPFVLFGIFVLLVISLSYFISKSTFFYSHNNLFSLAMTLDIAVLIPTVYYLIIRKSSINKITIVPIFVLSIVCASFIIPSKSQFFLDYIKFLLFPIELFVIWFLINSSKKIAARYSEINRVINDHVEILYNSLLQIFQNNTLAQILTTEISIFYYAFFGWNRSEELDHNALKTFSYHKNNGYSQVIFVFMFIIILETSILHYFISNFSVTLSWILTVLSIYGLLFLLADLNSVRKRPILVYADTLSIRIGFRWRVLIPLHSIEKVIYTKRDIKSTDGLLKAVLVGNQNLIIELKEHRVAYGLYGFKKRFNRISLFIDDIKEFEKYIKVES